MNARSTAWLVLATTGLLSMLGCATPKHLIHDYGRAYKTTMQVQADRTRDTVSETSYSLYGVEAVQIRLNVQAEATAQEDFQQTLEMN